MTRLRQGFGEAGEARRTDEVRTWRISARSAKDGVPVPGFATL